MKQYILKYQDFLKSNVLDESVLTPEQSEKYKNIKVLDNVKVLHDKFFNGAERIWLPFNEDIDVEKSKTQETVEELFSNSDYEIISYIQNQCRKKNDKNITKIGKVLVNPRVFNNPKLSEEYAQDISKLKGVGVAVDLMIVISRNSDDIASMSTKRAWDSCQNLDPNRFSDYLKEYVAKDLEQGSIIAYLVKKDDKEIDDPEARVLLKPFINQDDSKDIVFLPCTKVYHRGTNENLPQKYPAFSSFVMAWAKSVQPNLNGTYKMNHIVYGDGEKEITIYSKEQMERIENPKNADDYRLISRYYGLYNSLTITSGFDDLLEYEYGISFAENLQIKEAPKFLEKFKSIGRLSFNGCQNLSSLESLKNIEKIGQLDLSGTKIKFFNGLDNIEYIQTLLLQNTKISDFSTLKNIKKIDSLDLRGCQNLKSFKGLENCEILEITPKERVEDYIEINPVLKEKYSRLQSSADFRDVLRLFDIDLDILDFDIDDKGLLSYNGSLKIPDSLKTIPKVFNKFKHIETLSLYDCEKIEKFENLSNLKSIGRLLVKYSGLKGFQGLESVEEIGYLDTLDGTSIKSFEGLENCKIVDFGSRDLLINYIKFRPEFQERLKSPKVLEDFMYIFKYCGFVGIESENIKVLENGLVDYNGNFKIDRVKRFEEDELFSNSLECLKYFENINSLVIDGRIEDEILQVFKYIENLKSIESLTIQNCIFDSKNLDIKNIIGLENIKSIHDLTLMNCLGLENLEGLENLDSIGNLYIQDCRDLKSFKGLENCTISSLTPSSMMVLYTDVNENMYDKLNNPKSKQGILDSLYYYGLKPDYVKFDNDGFVIYDESLTERHTEYFKKFPKIFNYFKVIKGDLYIPNGIESLDGLKNLERIEGILYGYNFEKDFTELESIKYINRFSTYFDVHSMKGLGNCKIDHISGKNYYKYAMVRKDLKAILENPKTIEDFKTCFEIYGIGHKWSDGISVDEDGFLSPNYIDGNLWFYDIEEIPEFLKYIKGVKELRFFRCKVENLENLKNMETIKLLEFIDMDIKNFRGLDNFKSIDTLRINGCDNIESFEGLENCDIKHITPDSKYREYKLWKNPEFKETLKNPNTKENILECSKYFGFDMNELKIDEEKLTIIYDATISPEILENPYFPNFAKRLEFIGYLDAEHLENFDMFENLKGIRTLDFESGSRGNKKIKNFKGLEKVERIVNIYAQNSSLESFEGLDGIKNIKFMSITNTNIVNFKGLESCEDIRRIDMDKCTKFKSFTGLEECEVGYIKGPRYKTYLKWKEKLKS